MLYLLIALMVCLTATGANARAAGMAQGRSSTLSYERLQRLPPVIHKAFKAAQLLCMDDAISVRAGYLRYLKGSRGEEFIAIHFDQFGCSNREALCSPKGCLHRVFLSRRGMHREVWRGDVFEIDMSIDSGGPSIDVDCSRAGTFCRYQKQWDGKRFR
jgi:hypothetical protein